MNQSNLCTIYTSMERIQMFVFVLIGLNLQGFTEILIGLMTINPSSTASCFEDDEIQHCADWHQHLAGMFICLDSYQTDAAQYGKQVFWCCEKYMM
jgi:hypothetical protein